MTIGTGMELQMMTIRHTDLAEIVTLTVGIICIFCEQMRVAAFWSSGKQISLLVKVIWNTRNNTFFLSQMEFVHFLGIVHAKCRCGVACWSLTMVLSNKVKSYIFIHVLWACRLSENRSCMYLTFCNYYMCNDQTGLWRLKIRVVFAMRNAWI